MKTNVNGELSLSVPKLSTLKMRWTTLLLIVSLFKIQANSYSQTTKITLDVENANLLEIIDSIERQTDIKFLSSEEIINAPKLFSIKVKERKITSFLDELLEGSDIAYRIVEKQVILIKTASSNTLKSLSATNSLQEILIKGKVVDQDKIPLAGASILEKGTRNGVQTDFDGNFTISVNNPDVTLIVSYIGFENKEVQFLNNDYLEIVLKENINNLDEVVVVGYGTLDKKEVTSSVTSLKSKDILTGTSGNAMISIQGKVPGLTVVQSNGTSPNGGTSLQLRGVASINAGQGPLVVIDGVPGGSLNSVSPEDIESIDILKDASAGAIYGTRAAGGVVLITTKRGSVGALQLNYTGEFTTETIRRKPEVLGAHQFIQEGIGENEGAIVDWYDEVTVTLPLRQRNVLNLSGGSEGVRLYATLLQNVQEGIGIGDQKQEIGGRINTNFNLLNGLLEIMSHLDYRVTGSDFSNNGIFNQALKLNPTRTPYDSNTIHGYNVWQGGFDYYNPVADIRLRDNHTDYNRFLGDLTFKINLSKNFNSQFMFASRTFQERNVQYYSAGHKSSLDNNRNGSGSQSFSRNSDKTFEWVNNYKKSWQNHDLKAVGGYSFQEFNGDSFNASNADFPVDGIKAWDLGSGTYLSDGKAGMGSSKGVRTRLIAFFARANYAFKERYLLSLSGRYEGSSKFYKDNRWGMFPAVSAGWRISNEPFMANSKFIDELKIRGGYGITGNQNFAAGVANRMYSRDTWWLVDGEWISTYGLAFNQNKNLVWEEKKEFNIGLDFSLLDNKVSGKFDFYNRKVDNMIYNISVSVPPAIHDKTTTNVGSLTNNGWEAELSYNPVRNTNLDFSTTLRASRNITKLESLWGNQTFWDRRGFPSPGNPGTAVRLYPGEKIGQFFLWKHAGFSEAGAWLVYDKEGNTYDTSEQPKKLEDKRFIGNAIPEVQLSWDNNIKIKNFDINAFFTSWIGHDVFNMQHMYYGLPNSTRYNVLANHYYKNKHITKEKELTDYFLEDGTFVKLKSLTLRYNFDTENWFNGLVKNFSLYATGRNLFVLTNYSGLDPEVNITGLDPGFEDLNVYPRTREWTLGINLGL